MLDKRKLRILGFVVLNLLLINSPIIYSSIKNFNEDNCYGCYSLQKSANIKEAIEKATLVNSYRVYKTEFEDTLALDCNIKKIEFWKEHVQMVSESLGKSFEDTLFIWSYPHKSDEWRFKLLDKNQYREVQKTFGFWFDENQLKDTIIIGVFKQEKVNQGIFVYTKK